MPLFVERHNIQLSKSESPGVRIARRFLENPCCRAAARACQVMDDPHAEDYALLEISVKVFRASNAVPFSLTANLREWAAA